MIQEIILALGLGATVFTLVFNHKENKRQSTLDLIIHQRSNDKLNNAVNHVVSLARNLNNNSNSIKDLVSFMADLESSESKDIIEVLNFKEFVSVGINTGIIDEKVYKRAYCSVMIRDWKLLKSTIFSIREKQNKQTLFQDFEILAKRWEKSPLKEKIR